MQISVRHNIETAHRLYYLPGKCQNIHGHSMWITLNLPGTVDRDGILHQAGLSGLDFGSVKHIFRTHLDQDYDHHLLLNEYDPWTLMFDLPNSQASAALPGLVPCSADPTTENIAKWIYDEMSRAYDVSSVEVWETNVNRAIYGA